MSDSGLPKTPNGAPRVFLVGAGPGDPGLLTLRGAQALAMADVLLYDHLVPPELLDLAPEGALRIDAGKVRNHPRMSQQEIGAALVEHARRGALVVRLKGGDPFLFGRGGEEAQILAQAGIPFAVVPGVTSPLAVPAYAGIPVTHRDHSSRLVILTAHDDPDKWEEEDIKALARPRQTLVVLMGALYMKGLVLRLLAAGLPAKTPTAILRWGTTPLQETFFNDLGDLPAFLDRTRVAPPAILTVGEVVSLKDEVAWTHRLPLFGKRLLLTRDSGHASDLARRLQALGATVHSLPTIRISPLQSGRSDDRLSRLGEFQWIVFLSPNGVQSFIEALRESGRDLRSLAGTRIFSMGPATGEALKRSGLLPDLSPEESHGKGVVSAFRDLANEPRGKILLIRGDRGTGTIPQGLEALGYLVETLSVYENILPEISEEKKERLRPLLAEGAIDLAIYYSPSAFEGLLSLFPDQKEAIGRLPALAIGPTTRKELDVAKVRHVCMAAHPTTDSVVEAALDFLSAFGNNAEGRQPPPGAMGGQTQGETLP